MVAATADMTSPAWPESVEIHIRIVALDRPEPVLIHFERILSPDELLRANRLLNREARNRFVAGRTILRQTLAYYLNLPPAQIHLSINEHGKPRLAGDQAGSGLCFNLSHSDNLAILVLAHKCEVGVDMERIREDLEFHAMAKRFFSPREQNELFGLPLEQQLASFYRCWTRKEAFLKGCGSGFSQPSNCCDVSLLIIHPPSLLEHRTNFADPERWSLADITVPPGFCAALAMKGQIHKLAFHNA
jgi:4'-phosphopantetheinyl transferase